MVDTDPHRSKLDISLVALFVAAISAPTVDGWLRPVEARGPEAAELRPAAPRPKLDGSDGDWVTFPERYASYFNDSFGLRDSLLRWRSAEDLFLFGVSASPLVILGRDRWMFFVKESSMEVYRGIMPFTAEGLEVWRKTLESRREYLARRGIAYLFVLGPNKESIYPDYMPSRENRVGPTRMDQLVEYLARTHSDASFLDMRAAFIEERKNDAGGEHLYFQLGTHWSGPGNYVASREIQKRLHERFPAVRPRERSGVRFVLMGDHGDSEARRMYIEDLVPQIHRDALPINRRAHITADDEWGRPNRTRTDEVDDPTLPRAVVLHDSFGIGVEPLLAESFSHSTWRQNNKFDLKFLNDEKPDVVIELYVERIIADGYPTPIDLGRAVLYTLDPTRDASELEALGNTRIERGRDEEGDFVAAVTSQAADTFLLPRFDWLDEHGVLVDVDITTPVPTNIELYYLTDKEAEYTRRCCRTAALVQGRNRVPLVIRESGLVGRLRIRLGTAGQRYLLRGLEVHAAVSR